MTDRVDVVVEIPWGSRNKYEYDESAGVMRFDRRLPGSFAFPADYGFVPGALGTDDEPLDALVLMVEPTFPGVRVSCRLVGVFWLRIGERREAKLVCVPEGDPAYDGVDDMSGLSRHQRAELGNFFDIYRSLDPDSEATSEGSEGAEAAARVLTQARQRAAG
ncbi:inorganic diphosphatase [Pseudonocardia sp. RS11V-5]|uniref:inorganic diphosphatase n=1 Tax=Pseudonocardia terrae TaxID=2905831 RepID=UPI001E3B8F25|nr:inorganic diphosphatase [Pseudonocardia terrae]MCE3553650.1 inorganic diphosphatase [Pseudonocardia terrae]